VLSVFRRGEAARAWR